MRSFDFTVRSLSNLAEPLSVGDVFGRSVEDAARNAFDNEDDARRKLEREEARECGVEAVFDPKSWSIKRAAGTWKATGFSKTHRLCGVGIDWLVDANLSTITGRRDDRSRWQLFEAKWPSFTDMHVSPADRWTLVVTETELMIFEARSIDRPLLRVPKSSQENVVMVEWATGKNVARWNAEVVRLRGATR